MLKKSTGTTTQKIRLSSLKPAKSIEVLYRKELIRFAKSFVSAVKNSVLSFVKEKTMAKDNIGQSLDIIFEQLRRKFTGVAILSFSEKTAEEVVSSANKQSLARFKRIGNAELENMGVNLGQVIYNEDLSNFVSLSVSRNVSLIKSLPEEYFKTIETIVTNGLVNGERYNSIANKIVSATGANEKLKNRINTIARNETATLMSQLNIKRSEALGITKGIYRTSEDERVRPCHSELNGVKFDLNKGAWSKSCGKYIIPGVTDINCRCFYDPILEVEA